MRNFLLLILAVALAACSPAAPTSAPVTEEFVATEAPAETTEAAPSGVDLGYVTALTTYLGDDLALKTPSGMAVDGDGNLYVVDTLNHRLLIFDVNGNAVASWGTKGADEGQFNFQFTEELTSDQADEVLADVVVHRGEFVYVADVGNARIQIFDTSGAFLGQFPAVPHDDGAASQPISIAVTPEDFIYTMDLGFFISKYDAEGNLLARWGGPGLGEELFFEAGYIANDAQGNVYAADPYQAHVKKFDANGALLAVFPVPVLEGGAARQSSPFGVDVDLDGNLYVTDYLSNRVVVLDAAGGLLGEWHGTGAQLGQLYGPSGIALDYAGTVYVSEVYNNRVQRFELNN
jgi:DNA-binding beta-propeller fold protein YncE